MKQWQVLRTIFPEVITENFDFVDFSESDSRLDYWLEEREYMSREDFRKGTVRSPDSQKKRLCRTFQLEGRPYTCTSNAGDGQTRPMAAHSFTTTSWRRKAAS